MLQSRDALRPLMVLRCYEALIDTNVSFRLCRSKESGMALGGFLKSPALQVVADSELLQSLGRY